MIQQTNRRCNNSTTNHSAITQERDRKDHVLTTEEEQSLAKSARVLAEKAKVYDLLAGGHAVVDPDVQEDKAYLVDFDAKAVKAKRQPAARAVHDEVEVYPAQSKDDEVWRAACD